MFLYKMIMQNITVIVVSLIIGGLIACHTICGCSTISKEGFSEGAPLDWKMSDGVPGDSWSQPPVTPEQANLNMYASLEKNTAGPVPPKDMLMFSENAFLPECCLTPQQYSSSTGCACISKEQMQFLSSRGGNNTLP